MKTLWHDWENNTQEEMLASWDAPTDALDGATLLAAAYTYEDYSGSAYVLFERDGKLWCVNGGHCSCYGLEGQWTPEEVVPSADKDFRYGGFSYEFGEHVRATIASHA